MYSPSKEKKTVAEQKLKSKRKLMALMPEIVNKIPAEFLVLYKMHNVHDLQPRALYPDFLAWGKEKCLPTMPPRRKVVVENENKKKKKEVKIKNKDKEFAVRGIAGFVLTKDGFKYEVAWDKFPE